MKEISKFEGKYFFLSNAYPLNEPLHLEDSEDYPSVEYAYLAARTKNMFQRAQIRIQKNVERARALAKRCEVRNDWDQVKRKILKELLQDKFFNDADLGARLLSTYPIPIVRPADDLGELLMEVRQEIKDIEELYAAHVGK